MQRGTFYPELTLGAGALSASRRTELQQFLVEVIRQRSCPLHLANLWNAIYFNYDLGARGFIAAELAPERIPTRTARARDVGLPVGGFVRVHTQAACGDLLGEVIYKEGAHPEVDDGWIAPELSGAPATVVEEIGGQRTAIVRERFVLDLNAFGPSANHITHKQYERLCRRARWLDNHGHLLMEAMYTLDEAELEDLDYYAAYLLKEHREGLLAFCFSEELTGDELREALLRSFDAVRDLALTARELRNWRGKHFFLAADYDQRLNDDGPLGGGDLASLYRGLTQVPVRERCCYSAIGPRILELLERYGHDPIEQTLVSGSSYVSAVCHANSYAADRLTREQPDGVLASGVHLRLDDDWQGGGIWRAEHAVDRYSLTTVPPILPLGLGYAEAGVAEEAAEPTSADEQPIASSQTGFRVALTLRDRALGRLRLPAAAVQALAPGDIDVAIRHDETHDRSQVERDGSTLYGVEYPWDLHPGIVLHGNVEASGSVVRIRTVPVTPPLRASDGKSFDYDTNIAVYQREMKLTELSREEKRGALTLTELINRAFRLRGRVRDGWRVLSFVELAAILLGPGWRAVDTRPIADALDKMDVHRDGAHYLWRARVTQRTSASDRSLLAAYGEAKPRGRLDRAVRRHWVPMHLRRYAQRTPSAEKRRTYAKARLKYGMHGVLPEELPADCSWVEPYDWGDDVELTISEVEFDDETDEDRRRPVVFETLAE